MKELPDLKPPTRSATMAMMVRVIDQKLRGFPLSWRIEEDQIGRRKLVIDFRDRQAREMGEEEKSVAYPLPEWGTWQWGDLLDEIIRKASPPTPPGTTLSAILNEAINKACLPPSRPRPRASFRPSLLRGCGRYLVP